MPTMTKGAVGLREVARQLGVSYDSAFRFVTEGKLPGAFRLPGGGHWRVPVEEIEKLTRPEAALQEN